MFNNYSIIAASKHQDFEKTDNSGPEECDIPSKKDFTITWKNL